MEWQYTESRSSLTSYAIACDSSAILSANSVAIVGVSGGMRSRKFREPGLGTPEAQRRYMSATLPWNHWRRPCLAKLDRSWNSANTCLAKGTKVDYLLLFCCFLQSVSAAGVHLCPLEIPQAPWRTRTWISAPPHSLKNLQSHKSLRTPPYTSCPLRPPSPKLQPQTPRPKLHLIRCTPPNHTDPTPRPAPSVRASADLSRRLRWRW